MDNSESWINWQTTRNTNVLAFRIFQYSICHINVIKLGLKLLKFSLGKPTKLRELYFVLWVIILFMYLMYLNWIRAMTPDSIFFMTTVYLLFAALYGQRRQTLPSTSKSRGRIEQNPCSTHRETLSSNNGISGIYGACRKWDYRTSLEIQGTQFFYYMSNFDNLIYHFATNITIGSTLSTIYFIFLVLIVRQMLAIFFWKC